MSNEEIQNVVSNTLTFLKNYSYGKRCVGDPKPILSTTHLVHGKPEYKGYIIGVLAHKMDELITNVSMLDTFLKIGTIKFEDFTKLGVCNNLIKFMQDILNPNQSITKLVFTDVVADEHAVIFSNVVGLGWVLNDIYFNGESQMKKAEVMWESRTNGGDES